MLVTMQRHPYKEFAENRVRRKEHRGKPEWKSNDAEAVGPSAF